MDLSLTEAARLLGKSERQTRYLVRGGKIPARKTENGRWLIRREDLPLSAGQERAERQKSERAARLAEEILRPGDTPTEKTYSVRELRAYREGAPLLRRVVSTCGAEHPSAGLLREALMLLACGYHEFDGAAKAQHYGDARRQASRAAMALLLEDEEAHGELATELENVLMPALGGLINQAVKRDRRRRT